MPQNLANPIADSIRNLAPIFDPRRRQLTQETQAQTALAQQRTASEAEKTRGLKSQNDSYDQVDSAVANLFDAAGWDKNTPYAPVLSNAIKSARGKNPAQVMEGVKTALGLAEMLKRDPNSLRTGSTIMGHPPPATAAVTTGERDASFQQQQQLQQMRDQQSGANAASRLGVPGGRGSELAGIDAQIKALEMQYNKVAADWRLGKMAGPDKQGVPGSQKAGPFEAELEAMRAQHDALVQKSMELRSGAAEPAGAGGLFGPNAVSVGPSPTPPGVVIPPAAQQQQQTIDPQTAAAIDWVKANPNDPRVPAILQKLGIR